MTLTLPNLPPELGEALRKRAEAEGKTVDRVALEALAAGLHVQSGVKQRDLSDIAGTWVDDPAFEESRRYHEKIDTEFGD